MFKVVIFDMDGLLIDSQPWIYKAYNKAFTSFGYPISLGEWKTYFIHQGFGIRAWIEKNDLCLDTEQVRLKKNELYFELIQGIELKSGAKDLIHYLFGHFSLNVASSSSRKFISRILLDHNLNPFFDKVISGYEVAKDKPAPDIFLAVIKDKGVKPEECLVLEDSMVGVQAAQNAGMYCIHVPDPFSSDKIVSLPGVKTIRLQSLKDVSRTLIENL